MTTGELEYLRGQSWVESTRPLGRNSGKIFRVVSLFESWSSVKDWWKQCIFFSRNCKYLSTHPPPPTLTHNPTPSCRGCVCLCVCVLSYFSRVRLFATPWTVAHQDPLSMGFSRQEYWSGLPFPPPGDLPDPEMEPGSPALVGRVFTTSAPL